MTRAERAHPAEGATGQPDPPRVGEGGGEVAPPGSPGSRHGIGRVEGSRLGPTVVIFAGMHGNEPASVKALRTVLEKIREDGIPVRGTLIGILGNVTAYERRVRYVDHDLNRLWTHDRIQKIREVSKESCIDIEHQELWELVREVDAIFAELPEGASPLFLDLHTASASSAPFAISRNTLDHLSLFKGLPMPILAGLEESLEGLLLQHIIERGGRTVAIETGPHERAEAAADLEAAVWLLLISVGAIHRGDFPEWRSHRDFLANLCRGIPPIVEVFHRHEVTERARFRMKKGFRSFDIVAHGALLATDHDEPVRSPRKCRVLMPLYQEWGDDGFFLGIDRDRLYLTVSKWFRRLRLEWLLSFVPSVRRERDLGDAWRVDRTDREWVREALRFFGYRQQVRLKSGTILAWRHRR